ncbi:centromere protein H [Rhynochetos jubatus]
MAARELQLRPLAAAAAAEENLTAKMEVSTLVCLRDRMKEQRAVFSATADIGAEIYIENKTEEQLAESETQDLESVTNKYKVAVWNKTLALRRIQLMAALRNKINPRGNDSSLIVETTKHITYLCKKVIKYQQQLREKRQKLKEIRRNRNLLPGRDKVQKTLAMEKRKLEQPVVEMSDLLAKMHKKLEKERDMTTIIQHILLCMIRGCRINWAEEPSLKALVLQLEKKV